MDGGFESRSRRKLSHLRCTTLIQNRCVKFVVTDIYLKKFVLRTVPNHTGDDNHCNRVDIHRINLGELRQIELDCDGLSCNLYRFGLCTTFSTIC